MLEIKYFESLYLTLRVMFIWTSQFYENRVYVRAIMKSVEALYSEISKMRV